ncbi:MAG: isochorismatase family protein [Phyllobacteriaceae bacterium]|nr:isochorismatase family protein [Phyllobacteriaceae bacterium]
MADPGISQILLIDPVPARFGLLKTGHQRRVREAYRRLTEAADLARVPRYFAISDSAVGREHWLSTPCERNASRVHEVSTDRTVISNEALLAAMRDEMREQLFVCGFWLDDVVSSAALEALLIGFNAHLIMDLSPALDHTNRQATLDRLNQYGVPPISLRSLLYEWMAKAEDRDLRDALATLWQQQTAETNRGTSA